MKLWNAPTVEELDVKLTAGGFINMDIEFLFLTDNDNFKCPQTEEEDS